MHAQLHAASAGMYPVVMPDLPDAVEVRTRPSFDHRRALTFQTISSASFSRALAAERRVHLLTSSPDVHLPHPSLITQAWNGLQGLMQWYLSFSVVLIVISFIFGLLFFIFLPSGLMGTIAASMHLNERCRGRGSVIGAVGTIRVLSAVAATLDMILAGILFLVTLAAGGKAVGFFVALTMIYGGHGLISIHVFNQSSRVADAVNPVTRGVVVL